MAGRRPWLSRVCPVALVAFLAGGALPRGVLVTHTHESGRHAHVHAPGALHLHGHGHQHPHPHTQGFDHELRWPTGFDESPAACGPVDDSHSHWQSPFQRTASAQVPGLLRADLLLRLSPRRLPEPPASRAVASRSRGPPLPSV
jgi:hypothetical protein